MNIRRIKRKLKSSLDFFKGRAKLSYSQFGEDILVQIFFQSVYKKNNPTYLDIGTNDPVVGNNTYLFYLAGSAGVCVEPDPVLFEKIKSKRPAGINLHAGVGIDDTKKGDLFVFPPPYTGWNTFSKEEAELRTKDSGVRYSVSKDIPFIPVNELMEQYFSGAPDFVSVDVEGLDFAILQTIDFSKYKPAVFCIETTYFDMNHSGEKNEAIISFMMEKGYVVYADSYINTIFVRQDILQK